MKTLAIKNTVNESLTGGHKTAKPVQTPVSPLASLPIAFPYIQRKPVCACDGGCPSCTGVIQPKLTIGQPNDKYEQEADRVADQVMRMPDPRVQRKAGCSSCGDLDEEQIQTKPIGDRITPLVQRQVEEEEEEELQTKLNDNNQIQRQAEEEPEEEEEEPVQAKTLNNKAPPAAASVGVHNQVQSLKGGGQPLSESTRAFFEPRFGRDLSHVRVHTDAKAVDAAKSVNAKAFTTGRNVVFGAGQYSPGTSSGKHLMAHELTHVVQQSHNLKSDKPQLQRRVRDRFVSCRNPTPAIAAITGNNPVGVIRAADTRAIEMADEILEELRYIRRRIIAGEEPNWPLISEAISVPLQARLRLNPDNRRVWTRTGRGTVHLFITRLQSIRNLLSGGWIRYTCLGPQILSLPTCSGDCCRSGEACACENITRIWLCREFWGQSKEEQALTLLHEAFHVYYGWPNHPGRLTNACCLDMFMGYYFSVPITSGCPGVCS